MDYHMDEINQAAPRKKKLKSVYYFLGSLIVALGLTFLLREKSFTDTQVYVLFLLFFAMGLWLTEAIPPFAVSLFIMAYLVFTLGNPNFNSAPQKIDKYVNTFSSSIIWLLLGGFFLAKAMTKTKLDQRLLRLTLKISGTKPGNIVIAFMITSMIASMIMSNTAATAMLIAALMPLLKVYGKTGFCKAILLGISIGTATGGMATIIGTPANALSAGILENDGIKIDFLKWMLYGLPVAIALTAISGFVLLRLFVKDSKPVVLDFLENQKKEPARESSLQRNIVLVVLIITVLLWLTGSVHNISVSAVSAIPIVVLTLTGIITVDDVKSLSWDVLILIAGGMSLGVALESNGVLEHYTIQMQTIHLNPILLLFIFAFISMILSNVMSNAAACVVLIPLGIALIPSYETPLAISIALASSAGLFLPVSTPPNAILFSTGLLELKDFRLGGILIGILGPLLAVLWVLLVR
jgi:sodium-dependent dicarboxylate transporter 2/3/5